MPHPFNRRRLLAAGSAAALGAGALADRTATAEGRSERPDILLVFLDDLGYGDFGCYGSPLVRTPRLDALARQGARFTNAYAGAPVCTLSRVALLTGRVPARLGRHLMQALSRDDLEGLPTEERTIAGTCGRPATSPRAWASGTSAACPSTSPPTTASRASSGSTRSTRPTRIRSTCGGTTRSSVPSAATPTWAR